ncbi:pyridoxal phosphate-dependent aminotransferase [candidate division KSB1 bacterium]
MKFSECMSRLGEETAFKVLARARALENEGREIIHFEIGETGFDTPQHICEAAKQAIDDGYTHYEPANGILNLRETIAEDVNKTRKINITPDNVVVTPGAKPIMFFGIIACCESGDEVIYPNPGFPIYESVINFVGAKPVPIPLREENEFRMDIDELKSLITPKTRMIIINSPQNPTGGVLTEEDLKGLAEVAVKDDIIVMSDEVYKDIYFEGEHKSIISFDGMCERTIFIDGFSKTFSMTGWRLGYGVVPKELAEHIARLMVNSNSCTASFIQRAGIGALKGPMDEVYDMVGKLKERRDAIVKGLNGIDGISCLMPKGAFYVFPNIKGLGISSDELEGFLLNTAGIATLAGTSFGAFGEGYLRFAYCNSIENIDKAVEKIKNVLKEI